MQPWQPLLDWWFGPEAPASEVVASRQGLWFGKRDSQDREAVQRFAALRDALPEAERGPFDSYLDYAERHRAVIARFGRFPHRNAILSRASTKAELRFLEEPGSRF